MALCLVININCSHPCGKHWWVIVDELQPSIFHI